jgi:toxin YoeB
LKVGFTPVAWAEFRDCLEQDPKQASAIARLIEDIRRSPFKGLGKPEPLRNDLAGWWSRRVTREHRLVYRVTGTGAEQRVEIAQCRYHY